MKSKTEKNLATGELLTELSDSANDHKQNLEPQESGEIVKKQESALTERALKLHDENMKRMEKEGDETS